MTTKRLYERHRELIEQAQHNLNPRKKKIKDDAELEQTEQEKEIDDLEIGKACCTTFFSLPVFCLLSSRPSISLASTSLAATFFACRRENA